MTTQTLLLNYVFWCVPKNTFLKQQNTVIYHVICWYLSVFCLLAFFITVVKSGVHSQPPYCVTCFVTQTYYINIASDTASQGWVSIHTFFVNLNISLVKVFFEKFFCYIDNVFGRHLFSSSLMTFCKTRIYLVITFLLLTDPGNIMKSQSQKRV